MCQISNIGITIYSCEHDETDLFLKLSPRFGVFAFLSLIVMWCALVSSNFNIAMDKLLLELYFRERELCKGAVQMEGLFFCLA